MIFGMEGKGKTRGVAIHCWNTIRVIYPAMVFEGYRDQNPISRMTVFVDRKAVLAAIFG